MMMDCEPNEGARDRIMTDTDFDALYRQHNDLVFGYCYRHLPNPEDAADMAQIVWEKALRTTQRLQNPAAWLTTIAKNALVDYYRHRAMRRRRIVAVSLDEYDDENDGRNEKSPWLIDPGMDVDERAIWSEVLETGWQNCTDEQRQAMTLLLSGWRLIDIGAEMGREMGAGKQLLSRARENFRAALGAD